MINNVQFTNKNCMMVILVTGDNEFSQLPIETDNRFTLS